MFPSTTQVGLIQALGANRIFETLAWCVESCRSFASATGAAPRFARSWFRLTFGHNAPLLPWSVAKAQFASAQPNRSIASGAPKLPCLHAGLQLAQLLDCLHIGAQQFIQAEPAS